MTVKVRFSPKSWIFSCLKIQAYVNQNNTPATTPLDTSLPLIETEKSHPTKLAQGISRHELTSWLADSCPTPNFRAKWHPRTLRSPVIRTGGHTSGVMMFPLRMGPILPKKGGNKYTMKTLSNCKNMQNRTQQEQGFLVWKKHTTVLV